jgi:hypothetical protein
MINFFRDNLKNSLGWRTGRKIIVISVDDYGNVRLASRKARSALDKVGLKVHSRFDSVDALETKDDLSVLYETLTSVRDGNNRHAVFTPFALPCNIDFESIIQGGFKSYQYELLTSTFEKVASGDPLAYDGTWDMWKEGIEKGLLKPQFHGREHLNLKVFEEKLAKNDNEVIELLNNRSYTSISSSGYPTISYTAAFDFWDFEENRSFPRIICDGLNAFEKVFGYRSVHFNAPGAREHSTLHVCLKENGIKYIDANWITKEHQGKGVNKRIINYTGKQNLADMHCQVRNVVFEPTFNVGYDWVEYSMKQIELAFFWNRPAIISSHRVNFCGHIDEPNRRDGISSLKALLKKIVKKWPEVEFMSSDELGETIRKSKTSEKVV